MPIAWSADGREFHLRNDLISYAVGVNPNGSLGHRYFGPALAADRTFGHIETPAVRRLRQPRRRPGRARIPDDGFGRLPGAGPDRRAGRRLGRPRARLRRAPRPRRQARPSAGGRPAGRPTSSPTRRRRRSRSSLADERSGLAVELSYTVFGDRPVVARSTRIRNNGAAAVRLTGVMSATLDLPDARWELVQLSGAWARENHVITSPLRPGRQSVGSDRGTSSAMHNPFIALRRATTTEAEGEAIGFSLVYSGNFIAEAEVDPFDTTRVRIGISPNTLQLDARAGRRPSPPRRRSSSTRRRARRDERRPPSACIASGSPAEPGATRRDRSSSTTGRRPTSGSTRRSCSVSRARRATSASSCSCSTTAGSASAITTRLVAGRLGRRPAQAARRARRPRRQGRGARSPVRDLDRARDGQPAEPAVRGPPGLGRRHPGPAADREPPAARPRPVAARDRRPPRSASCPRSSRARRSRTSSGT